MTCYKSKRPVDGKSPIWVIVDETGTIVNYDPNKDELKILKEELYAGKYKDGRSAKTYTDKQLLNYFTQFYEENGRPPKWGDFANNPEYSAPETYKKRFGGWQKALKLVGLDTESMVKKGIIETNQQKGRLAEILIIDHFEKNPVDLAGENYLSPCDGICPNGKYYDVKSSALGKERNRWHYGTNNKYKDKIEIYYLLAFNEDYSELMYAWRMTNWEVIDIGDLYIGMNSIHNRKRTVENMKEYDITDKIRDILKKYEFFNKAIY